MSDISPSNHDKLFDELSTSEQESIIAGQSLNIPGLGSADFFLQNTNIESGADNNVNLGGSESSSQNSQYKLSQLTIAASLKFLMPNGNNPQLPNTLSNILAKLFS